MQLRASAVILVAVNLVPVVGVIAFGWQVADVLILYWLENVVVGAVNVLRMLVTPTDPGTRSSKVFLVSFFTVHYGVFCFGHLLALQTVVGMDSAATGAAAPTQELLQDAKGLTFVALGLLLSHLFSFAANFIGGNEYRRTNLRQLMRRPYGRIAILHVTLIVGGALLTHFGQPLLPLIVLVVVKTAVDLRLHLRERAILVSSNGT